MPDDKTAVRVIVAPGKTVHMGDHAFGPGDALTLPAAHAAELVQAGSAVAEIAGVTPVAPAAE
jgi:hypothetical protein